MTYSLGVDLGTTFVAAAVARPAGIVMVPLGDQSVVAPAVVAVRPDGGIVTGDAAERRAISQPALVARSVKRRLGDQEPIRLGDGRTPSSPCSPHSCVTSFGKWRTKRASHRSRSCSPTRRHGRRCAGGGSTEVAQAAGLDAPRLVTAAEAAAHHAVRDRMPDGGTVAVYDLGGGGFEATVVRARHRQPRDPG